MNCFSKANILKKTLVNNAIALGGFVLSIAAVIAFLFITSRPEGSFAVVGCGIALFVLLYILCGFFLIPVRKFSFLSVLSVLLIPIIFLLTCILLDEVGTMAAFLAPFAFLLSELGHSLDYDFPDTVFFLAFAVPSLLMYLGMALRKVIVKRKAHE